MVEVWKPVIFSQESLEFIGIEGVRNSEKKNWNSMLWNVEKSLEFQHPFLFVFVFVFVF